MNIRRWMAALVLCSVTLSGVWAQAEDMRMMGLEEHTGRDWAQNVFFARMAERTGVSFTYMQYGELAAYAKEKERVLTGDDLPDVLFKAALSPQEELRYGQDGTLIDLAPLLAEHAPNLWALLEQHPDWREAITLPDGKIVALPGLDAAHNQVGIWVNTVWLDALKIPMPTTPEAYREALVALRDGDPNQNGKADEVPLMLIGPWEAKWFASFFGLMANDYNVFADEAGAVRFAPLEPGYREFLTYMHGLFTDGLLYKSAFRDTHASLEQSETQATTLRLGSLVSISPATLLDVKYTTGFSAVPPMAAGGKAPAYRDMLSDVQRGTFAITRACKEPAAALRWVDALYAEEGAILAMAGLEGEDYQRNEDGTWTFLVDQMRSADSLQAYAVIGGGMMPGIQPTAFLKQISSPETLHMLTQYEQLAEAATLPIPPRTLTADQLAEIDSLQLTLGRLVDMRVAQFITGELPLDDATWAAYELALQDAGAQRMTALWQGVVDAR